MTTDRAPRTEWPPGAGPQVPRGGPHRATADFEAVLDSQKAWTAPAGGPDKKEPQKAPKEKHAPASGKDATGVKHPEDAASPDTGAQTTPVAPAEDAALAADQASVAAEPVPAAPAAPATQDVLTEPRPPAGQVEAPAQSGAPSEPGTSGAQPAAGAAGVAQTPVAPTASPEATVAPEPVQQAAPTGDTPEVPARPAAQPATPAPAKVAAPADSPAQEEAPAGQQPRAAAPQGAEARGGEAATAAPESSAAAQSRPAGPGPQAPQAAQAPQAPASAPAAPQATPAPATRALAHTGPTTLAQTVESVQATLRLAASHGVTRARLALHPAELGGVEVNLRSSAAGLVATVRADSPEAAKLLQQAAGQLRDALHEQGLNLLQLDIGSSGERQVGAGAHRDGRPSGTPGEPLATPDEDEPEVTASVRLPNGVLVDVLA